MWEADRPTHGSEEFLFLGARQDRARRRLGTIRLALPLGPALETADQISNQVLWIVTLVNLLGLGVSLFYVRKILRPIHLMAAATERLGQGELGETVPVLSNDEMGRLAVSFNRMSRDLAATTVSERSTGSPLDRRCGGGVPWPDLDSRVDDAIARRATDTGTSEHRRIG